MFSAELPLCLVFVQKSNYQEKSRKICQKSYFTRISRSQNTRRRRARGWPHHLVARARLGHARGWCGPPGTPSVSLFAYKKPSDLKTPGGFDVFPGGVPLCCHHQIPRNSTRNSVLAPCRDGELEEIIAIIITIASPSTIHVPPSMSE